MIKIIIDNSNLSVGGGIQVATSFLNDLNTIGNQNHEYHVIQSFSNSWNLDEASFGSNFIFHHLSKSSRFIPRRIREVRYYEKSINPKIIFTTFGPSFHGSNVQRL
jgi:hypothetical protein